MSDNTPDTVETLRLHVCSTKNIAWASVQKLRSEAWAAADEIERLRTVVNHNNDQKHILRDQNATLQAQLDAKDTEIARRDTEIYKFDALEYVLRQQLADKDAQIAERDATIAKMRECLDTAMSDEVTDIVRHITRCLQSLKEPNT